MSKVVRSVKNVTKGYSSVQVKVRNATSNDPWGPTGTEMSEIAQMTFNGSNDFYEIMDMLDKRLNDKGKNWRHVLKSLKVLDYCLHEGSELVVTWARKNVYIIKTLREFQYIDDDGKDVGQNVRVSAKELTSLIMDEERLRIERSDRKSWKSRVTGIDEFGPQTSNYGEPPHQRPQRRKHDTDEEDAEYRLAIEASKYEAEEDKKRRHTNASPVQDDDLAKAIKLSKEEEELRRRELEESNAASLFDETPIQTQQQQPQFTGYNQGYQQQGQVDFFGNPINQQPQQPQTTGYLNNAYSQPTGFQSQQTGFQNGFQPQQTNLDQSQFQQPLQYLQQQNTVQPQQSAFDNLNNPYLPQQNGFGGQQQQQQQIQSQQAGSLNPWVTGQQQSTDALKPAPTGTNNPFATNRPQVQQQQPSPPTLSSLTEQKTATQFNQQSSYNPISNYPVPQQPSPPTLSSLTEQKTATQFNQQSSYNPISNYPVPQQPPPNQTAANPHHERLNALLASGEGMDTFGNTGELRIPAHHTAPGTFVNSSGQGLERLHANKSGSNPFFSQQFTGQPSMQGSFGAQQQMPAQTGPAGMFGQANNNPFGARQPSQGQPQGGSLIDL
ncbi:MAG: hypothetical protein Q9163_005520 [Psora crenata]